MSRAAVFAFAVALPMYGCGRDTLFAPDEVPRQTPTVDMSMAAKRPLSREATLRVALDDAIERLVPALTDVAIRESLAVVLTDVAAGVEHARFAETRRALDQALAIIARSDATDPDAAAIALVLEQVDQLFQDRDDTPAAQTSN